MVVSEEVIINWRCIDAEETVKNACVVDNLKVIGKSEGHRRRVCCASELDVCLIRGTHDDKREKDLGLRRHRG